jgi:hypothetical protein
VFNWGARKVAEPASVVDEPAEPGTTSKVMPRFLAALAQRPDPILLDLGPVVGANVEFFGDRLACKIFVEDLFADVETHARRGVPEAPSPDVGARLTQLPGSVDGILCWDLFDYLDKPASQALATRLTAMLRQGGALYGLFGTTAVDLGHYTRFVIESDDTMRHRPYAATLARRHVLTTRDINRMFDGLRVAESVLLKANTRETLFRKP